MGRNWSRKSIEEIAKQVAKGITSGNPCMTIHGVREWGYPPDSSPDNRPWGEGYFMDIEIVEKNRQLVTMYLPLPIFNGSINSNGFIDKGITGVSYDYDPIKGQLAFVFNDCSEPTVYSPSDDSLLYRGWHHGTSDWLRPLSKLSSGNIATSTPNEPWQGTITLYKASLAREPLYIKNDFVVKLGDIISEKPFPKLSEFNVFKDCYAEQPWNVFDSEFEQSVNAQDAGYSIQALQFLESPNTDEWKHYNLSGTTYAFNSDKSNSVAITGRGLPAAAVSSFSNKAGLTHKVYVSGTLLNDLLFNQEYDVFKKDNNNEDYVSESAVLKITFKL